MIELGYPARQVHLLGESVGPALEQILSTITGLIDGPDGVLIGMVNIHTQQAELLIEHFEHLQGDDHRGELEESRDPRRQPAGINRIRRASGRTGSRRQPPYA
jgi:hypothetical protein